MPILSQAHMMEILYLMCSQFANWIKLVELEGNYYPKEFTDWKEFSAETKELMCREFGLVNSPYRLKDCFAFEDKYTPLVFGFTLNKKRKVK